MKKIILVCLILLLCSYSYGKSCQKIDLYCGKDYLQSYTPEQFEALLISSGILLSEREAEMLNRVTVELSDKDYIFENNTYTGFISITWKDENGGKLKEIKLKATLTLADTDPSLLTKIDNFYTKTSRILFPILLGILAVAAVL